MRKLLRSILHWLPLLLCLPLAGAAEEALPLAIFKKLQGGEKQTVVVYGTSLSIGGAWAKALDEYFAKEFPGQVTFINSAKAGMHSNWGVENLQARVLERRPDLVFIEFSANDAATKHGISKEKSAANLEQMVKALRQQDPQVDIVLQTMNPAWDSPKIEKNYGSDRPELPAYYEVYRSYAKANQVPLADHYPVWLKMQTEELERYKEAVPDGIHPNSEASRATTWPTVRTLLENARLAAAAKLAAPLSIDVWPADKMPGKGAREAEARHSPERTDAIRITNVSQPTLTVFPAAKKDSPAVIVCPGGGYSYVVTDKEGTEIAAWLNSRGIGALVLKYRVPNNRMGAFQDLQRATRLARQRCAEWNIDPKRLGFIGFSAGGHLAARASTRFGERSYPAIDEVDQQSCRPDFAMLVYPAYLQDKNGGLSPDLDLGADIPPTLIVHSVDDEKFITGSQIYAGSIMGRPVLHELQLYRTGGHGYGLRSDGEARAWPQAAIDWLGKNGMR